MSWSLIFEFLKTDITWVSAQGFHEKFFPNGRKNIIWATTAGCRCLRDLLLSSFPVRLISLKFFDCFHLLPLTVSKRIVLKSIYIFWLQHCCGKDARLGFPGAACDYKVMCTAAIDICKVGHYHPHYLNEFCVQAMFWVCFQPNFELVCLCYGYALLGLQDHPISQM